MQAQNLLRIYDDLRKLLRQLIYDPTTLSYESWKAQLYHEVTLLSKVDPSGALPPHCQKILGKINKLAESLAFICVERISLKSRCESVLAQNSFHSFDAQLLNYDFADVSGVTTFSVNQASQIRIGSQKHENSSQNLSRNTEEELNLMTPSTDFSCSTPSSAKSEIGRTRRRLPKEHVSILNQWYQENSDNPYLTRDDIRELCLKTGLRDSQIKNWASNRRRKKPKLLSVSKEVMNLLY